MARYGQFHPLSIHLEIAIDFETGHPFPGHLDLLYTGSYPVFLSEHLAACRLLYAKSEVDSEEECQEQQVEMMVVDLEAVVQPPYF